MDAEGRAHAGQEQGAGCGRQDLLGWAAGLRNLLRLHLLLGIRTYPMVPELKKTTPVVPTIGTAKPAVGRAPAERAVEAPGAPSPEKKTGSPDRQNRLRDDIVQCSSCSLATGRCGQTPGRGRAGAPLMVVGDFLHDPDPSLPQNLFGREEDAMFEKMIQAMRLSREQVYVTNVLKCCPPPGWQPPLRAPQCCLGFLDREIELVRPRVLLAMGDLPARSLLGSELSALRLRGHFHEYRANPENRDAIALMVTLHPHALLIEPALKKAVWGDLQKVLRRLGPG